VTKVAEGYIGVEIAEGTEITVQKSAVTTILPKGTIKSLWLSTSVRPRVVPA
jgi:preprotein translocase subunit YajC